MRQQEELQIKIAAEKAKEAERRMKEEKQKKELSESNKEATGSDDDSSSTDKNNENQEDDEYDDEEDLLFRVYFKDHEIEQAMEMQKIDHFDELLDLKQEATAEASEYLVNNKINISEFIPKESKNSMNALRQSRRYGKLGEHLPGIEEENDEGVTAKGEDDLQSLQSKMAGKKYDKEVQEKIHQLQMHSLDGEINDLIRSRLDDSPRSTGSMSGMKKRASSKKKKR